LVTGSSPVRGATLISPHFIFKTIKPPNND
jgi:hypothetical protein